MIGTLRRAWLFTRAYAQLLRIQRVLLQRGFSGLQADYLLPWKPGSRPVRAQDRLAQEVEWAVEQACAWQLRRTVCLHRATLAYSLLRAIGGRPRFVMGVAGRPFGSHAWVELEGEPFADGEMEASRYHFRPILSLPATARLNPSGGEEPRSPLARCNSSAPARRGA